MGPGGIRAPWRAGPRRPPAWKDAPLPCQDVHRRMNLHHESRGSTVADVPPRSHAPLWCAGLRAGKTHAFPNRAPPWPGIKRLGAPGRVRPPPWEDALATSRDAGRRGILHHKSRGTIVAGVPPRSDAALCCDGLIAGKTRAFPTSAPPRPGIKRVSAPGRVRPPPGRTPLHRLKARGVGCICPINQAVQSSLASPRGRTRPSGARS